MTTISAKSILASFNTSTGDRVDTLLLRYPRFIHSEFMTHRLFSRNASSSRAIPVSRIIADILADPAVPLHWGKNQKGMQADEECNELVHIKKPMGVDTDKGAGVDYWLHRVKNKEAWLFAMHQAIEMAKAFDTAGYHKQIVNRLLEPFSHITVVVSSTQWSNFIALRDHKDAEPHIAMLARAMREALEEATVQPLKRGEWHLPFVTKEDRDAEAASGQAPPAYGWPNLIKLSVARCASTSYKTVDGFDMTLERAIALHDKLVAAVPLHASPCEHQCQADDAVWVSNPNRITRDMVQRYEHPEQHGNFKGFRQYRKMLAGECS